MRRFALLGLVLLLPACSGAGTFLEDTHSLTWNPNRPIGDSENMRRVRGLEPQLQTLVPESGNVWPGPVPPEPTLSDLERDTTSLGATPDMFGTPPGGQGEPPVGPALPDHRQPRPITRGSSTPPPNDQPGLGPALPGPTGSTPSSAPGPGPNGRVYQTPEGPAVGTRTQGRVDTINPVGHPGSIVVPNGNGTSTIISPDGSITTVPTPR